LAFGIGKDEVLLYTAIPGQCRNLINNRLRDWELIPCSPFQHKARNQTKKITGALDVPGRSKAYGWDTAGLHGVSFLLVIFVDFAVGSEGGVAVVLVVKAMA
jgi:hypothetical protein